MESQELNSMAAGHWPLWSPVQRVVLGVLVVLIAGGVGWAMIHGWEPIRPLADSQTLQLKLDPNTASAAELACIPEVGPRMAARIVACRERLQSQGKVAYRRPADLDAVEGIGKATIAAIQDYLTFPRPRSPK
jgi:DNA uptake protein ComE-like DNA-binding protein